METNDTHVGAAPGPRGEARRPYLMVIGGTAVGDLHKLTRERTIVGRGPAAQLRLEDVGISREHAELVVDSGRVIMRDLGSTNGTYLNGVRADARDLRDGDKLSIGAATLLVFTHQDGIERDYQRNRDHAAGRDPATAALKRDVFVERLAEEISFSRRHAAPLALLLWDVDSFASVEARHGAAAMRGVLSSVVRAARDALHDDDIVAFMGPGQFAVACRETSAVEAERRAERLRAAVSRVQLDGNTDAPTKTVTTSVGVAVCAPGTDRSPKAAAALLRAAAEAMARARDAGGNRVESAPAPDVSP